MNKFKTRIKQTQQGQVLLATMIFVMVGGLLLSMILSFSHTIMTNHISASGYYKRLYSAESGIYDALWCLKNNVSPRSSLPANLNDVQVTIQVSSTGNYTLYADEWVSTGTNHFEYLDITSTIEWDAGAGAYKFTITITRTQQATGNIKLEKVGAQLPSGYTYVSGSAASFPGNLSTGSPSDTLSSSGCHLLEWSLGSPRPELSSDNPSRTQIFYMTGSGQLKDYYSWAITTRQDVGTVGELSGACYIIISTATGGSKCTIITAKVISTGDHLNILSWEID